MEQLQHYFQKLTRSWSFYHYVFWIFTITGIAYDIKEYIPYDLKGFLLSVLIRVGLIILLVYTNLFILIPYLYRKKKYVLYWFFIIVLVVVFSTQYRIVYFISTKAVYELSELNFIGSFFGAVRFLFISLLLRFLQEWFEQETKLNKIKVNSLSTELNYLRSQINPHFLFNTLNNLFSMAQEKANDELADSISKLSGIMRYMIYESNVGLISLEKEIENLKNYIGLNILRYNADEVRIDFNVATDISGHNIAPMILLPFVENAFKHGVAIRRESFINIFISRDLDNILFECTNSDHGHIQKMNDLSGGIGLENVKRRLDLIYPRKYELKIEKTNGRYKTELIIKSQ